MKKVSVQISASTKRESATPERKPNKKAVLMMAARGLMNAKPKKVRIYDIITIEELKSQLDQQVADGDFDQETGDFIFNEFKNAVGLEGHTLGMEEELVDSKDLSDPNLMDVSNYVNDRIITVKIPVYQYQDGLWITEDSMNQLI